MAEGLSEKKIGEAIFKKGLSTGCYGCHAASSNPQIKELIKAGTLTKERFATVLKEGSGGMMPKNGIGEILKKVKVKKQSLADHGVTEDQAIDAIYNYLKTN